MAIPLVDLKAQYLAIQPEVQAAIGRVLDSTRFIAGPELTQFEAEFAAFCAAEHCVGVASGTTALSLALQAAGIGPGDEVITSTFTFAATVEAILHVGAWPVLVDVDPATATVPADLVLQAVTGRTKAILPVHLYGHPADMEPLLEICSRYGLLLLNDAAQAHGARYKGTPLAQLGQASCFSFYPGKNLGAYGDAGAVVTQDPTIATRVRALADHGREAGSKYEHALVGYNGRMDALQAAVLRAKLPHLSAWNDRRRALASRYDQAFEGSQVRPLRPAPWATPVYHLYVVRLPRGTRPAVQQALSAAGIATGVHYPIPLHLQPAFSTLGHRQGDFPAAEDLADTVLSLPLYPELDESQVDTVATRLLSALADC